MEPEGEESRSTLPGLDFYPLGFFLQPQILLESGLTTPPPPCAKFMSTSVDHGKDLEAGKWGSLDASLSFLEQTVHIVASCHGFLLCTTDIRTKMKYIICNPVTREYVILPEPKRYYGNVAMAFICKGDGVSFGDVRFEVVRAGVANCRELMTVLEIEIFSSDTGEWQESSIVSPSPFKLLVANTDTLVLEDIIYWKDPTLALVAYDRARENVEIIKLPRETFRIWSDFVSQSMGKIFYARTVDISGTHYIEIWVLDGGDGDNDDGVWSMKHTVSLMEMIQRNPMRMRGRGVIGGGIIVKHMHPLNSKHIFLQAFGMAHLYDTETRELIRISNLCTITCVYFLYEWPCASLPQ